MYKTKTKYKNKIAQSPFQASPYTIIYINQLHLKSIEGIKGLNQ